MTKIAVCNYCQREYPLDSCSPKPGSTGPVDLAGAGHWDRTVLEVRDGGDLVFSDWYFVGPCCEHSESWWQTLFDDEEDCDDYDLDAHPIQCEVCGGEIGESWSTCNCLDDFLTETEQEDLDDRP